ncbi:MAG: translation initiation factor IF-3 [Candidatus Sericytochromatia bacterium]
MSKDTGVLVNEQIRVKEIRVIDSDSSQLGIMTSRDALELAREKELDLVMVSPSAVPPVCKIMDFGRHKYEQEKKNKEAKKKQHSSDIKELTVSYKIGEHDFQVRVTRVKQFVEHGDKVKMCVKLRGREEQHSGLGINLLNRFAKEVEEFASVEKIPKLEGRQIIMILAPKKGG